MADYLVEVKDIKKYFRLDNGKIDKAKAKYLHAVDHVSFKVERGEIFGIIGESGSGKSTIGRCILGLLEIDSGEVYFDGKKISGLPARQMKEYRKDMQMVFQNPLASFNPKKTIGSIFNEIVKVYKIPKEEGKKRIHELVEYINLTDDVLTRLPKELSGGQLQRLAIARALLRKSPIIIFDESTSSLDNFAQNEVKKSIDSLKGTSTIIIVAHRLSTIKDADTIFFLDHGEIVDKGTFDELYARNDTFKTMFLAENI